MTRSHLLFVMLVSGLLLGCGGNTPEAKRVPSAPTLKNEGHQSFDNFTVHYYALTTDQLPSEVTQQYNIIRSATRAMLNVVVNEHHADSTQTSTTANIVVKANNLTGQVKPLSLREIRDGDAIYYLGDTAINHGETLVFDMLIQPEGYTGQPHRVKFQQAFFTEPN